MVAPLGDEAVGDLPQVIEKMRERFVQEVPPEEIGALWTTTDILMGLRYSREFVTQVMKGVSGMKESVTYQAIVEEGFEKGRIRGKTEGKLEGKREILIRTGKKQFGAPEPNVLAVIEGIKDAALLDQLCERVLDVDNWQDLIGGA